MFVRNFNYILVFVCVKYFNYDLVCVCLSTITAAFSSSVYLQLYRCIVDFVSFHSTLAMLWCPFMSNNSVVLVSVCIQNDVLVFVCFQP